MSEPRVNERKMVRRSVAVALGIICIILIAFVAYFTVTDISEQNSINNLQSQVKDLTDTVNFTKIQVWVENMTVSSFANSTDIVDSVYANYAGFILVRTSSANNDTYVRVSYSAVIPMAGGTLHEFSYASYHYYNKISVPSYQQDNIFPILPSNTEFSPTIVNVWLGNSNPTENANMTVSIVYYC
jgi:hypothetical protein